MKNLCLLAGILLLAPFAHGDAPELSARLYKPKNIDAGVLSGWLDPTNALGTRKVASHADKNKTNSELPEGAKGVFHLARSGEIVIVGTPASIEETLKIVQFLDVPRRQVELEAKWVEVSISDSRAFGLDWIEPENDQPAVSPQSVHLAFARPNYVAVLGALQTKERARVLMAPRVTTFTNTQTPIFFSVEPDAKPLVSITPTVNGDDTVALGIGPATPGAKGLVAFANVRDGDTLVVGNWPVSPFEATGKDKGKGKTIFLFLTARIVRRVGE